ncbi:MAG: DUF6089 family protein [Bacteroidota bacterium]
MNKFTYSILFLLLFMSSAYAQRHELGVFAGGSYYLGDLNPSGHFAQSKPAVGIIYRYNMNPRWALRVNALFGSVEGSDALDNKNNPRNLSFKSPITEFSVLTELNFLQFYTKSERYMFSPYIFAGLGIFNFNPQAQYEGKWYELQPLGTEGQTATGKSLYALTSVSVPFGIGIKIGLFKAVCLGLEWGMRKTFTDYIDDVSTTYVNPNSFNQIHDSYVSIARILADRSEVKHVEGAQRGNSSNNDWYNFYGLTLSFHLGNKEVVCPAFSK